VTARARVPNYMTKVQKGVITPLRSPRKLEEARLRRQYSSLCGCSVGMCPATLARTIKLLLVVAVPCPGRMGESDKLDCVDVPSRFNSTKRSELALIVE